MIRNGKESFGIPLFVFTLTLSVKLGYHTLKSGYGTSLKILEIAVIWPFLNRLIIKVYNFEVIIAHLDLHDPTIKL